jgi:hypothetical protein
MGFNLEDEQLIGLAHPKHRVLPHHTRQQLCEHAGLAGLHSASAGEQQLWPPQGKRAHNMQHCNAP